MGHVNTSSSGINNENNFNQNIDLSKVMSKIADEVIERLN